MAESNALSVVSSAVSSVSNPALRNLKDRSAVRRKLLAQTLGVQSPDVLPNLLGTSTERNHLKHEQEQRVSGGDISDISETPSLPCSRRRDSTPTGGGTVGFGSPPSVYQASNDHLSNGEAFVIAKRLTDSGSVEQKAKRRRTGDQSAADSDGDETIMEPFDDYFQVLQEEEKVYRGSATFLKGTQSANPHNDYCQHFIDTGQRPQNFIRDSGLAERFDEYPKLKELIKLKDELVTSTATPPMYLKCDLRTYDLRDIGSRFDVILIEPPLEEYHITGRDCWNWDDIERLDIGAVADTRAFLWLWCGSTPEALQRGRNCLKRWGFRRCEDICWVKTNKTKSGKEHPELTQSGAVRFGAGQLAAGNSLLQRSKEHCLMGIKGTVRRSTDGDFIHANVDIDLIITEEPPPGSIEKPLEIVLIAEHFCLGRRRLHLFGRDDTLRPGWVTIGPELTSSNFDASRYRRFFERPNNGNGYTTGCTDRIEQLRPKSPVPMDKRGGGGNLSSRPDGGVGGGGGGGGGNAWQRTGNTNIRDRPRGAISGPRHMPQGHGHQKTPPLHDRDRDHRFDKDTRNGMTVGGNGRSDRFTSTRTYGSQRGSYSMNYGRGRDRDSNGSRSGIRRNF